MYIDGRRSADTFLQFSYTHMRGESPLLVAKHELQARWVDGGTCSLSSLFSRHPYTTLASCNNACANATAVFAAYLSSNASQ
jgi:hypothetical protein